jgi:hypothetical protein
MDPGGTGGPSLFVLVEAGMNSSMGSGVDSGVINDRCF